MIFNPGMFVKATNVLINNMPVKKRSILIWDLENMPFRDFGRIISKLDYTPEKAHIVSSQKLGKQLRSKIKKRFFQLHDGLGDSDRKIKQIMNILSLNEEFIIISSDADFINISKELLKQDKKVTFIVHDSKKKRIMMKSKLTDKNLRIKSI